MATATPLAGPPQGRERDKPVQRTKGARPDRKEALLEENLRAAMLLIDQDAGPDRTRHVSQ